MTTSQDLCDGSGVSPQTLFFFSLFNERKNYLLWVNYQEINLSSSGRWMGLGGRNGKIWHSHSCLCSVIELESLWLRPTMYSLVESSEGCSLCELSQRWRRSYFLLGFSFIETSYFRLFSELLWFLEDFPDLCCDSFFSFAYLFTFTTSSS